jgi:hypothetical protein
MQGPDGTVLRMQLACNQVFTFDSVNGDGSSVRALSEAIFGQVSQLPMMSELIPSLWAEVRKIVQQSYCDNSNLGPLGGRLVLQRDEAIMLLRPIVLGDWQELNPCRRVQIGPDSGGHRFRL